MLGGAGLAALGAVFCVLLAYVLVKQVPGGCGCIRWRTATRNGDRSGDLAGHGPRRNAARRGIAYMLVSADAANAPRRDWFGGGVVAGGAVLVLLSMRMPVRTPVCRRPLWHRTRTTLRALASHEMFAAMAASAGPFGPVARYRRTGCTDEFWFTAAAGQERRGSGIPGPSGGARRPAGRPCVTAGQPGTRQGHEPGRAAGRHTP